MLSSPSAHWPSSPLHTPLQALVREQRTAQWQRPLQGSGDVNRQMYLNLKKKNISYQTMIHKYQKERECLQDDKFNNRTRKCLSVCLCLCVWLPEEDWCHYTLASVKIRLRVCAWVLVFMHFNNDLSVSCETRSINSASAYVVCETLHVCVRAL